MFWGCKIKDNLPYAINVNGECILNISQICLKEQYSKGKVFVNISNKKEEEFTIAILQRNGSEYQAINLILNLKANEQQKIYITGAKGEVHLTGCIMLKSKSQLSSQFIKAKEKKAAPIIKEEEKEVHPQINIEQRDKEGDKLLLEDNSDIDMNEIDYLLKKRKRSLSK